MLADVHSSTVPDSPNTQITQIFTLVKGHTSGAVTNPSYGWASPKPLMGKEANTTDVYSLMPFTRNVWERRSRSVASVAAVGTALTTNAHKGHLGDGKF